MYMGLIPQVIPTQLYALYMLFLLLCFIMTCTCASYTSQYEMKLVLPSWKNKSQGNRITLKLQLKVKITHYFLQCTGVY